MTAYYNEINPDAAERLEDLIAAGLIAPGVVDRRSIEDVYPGDLDGFTQCHFFAGFGIWSLALRRAGWPDDRPVWTGSCPCQPFSSAGEGAGFDDERHLWPHFHWLISQRRPPVVYGEQVASKDAEPWLDLVRDDLEGLAYAFWAVAFPSAGVGAPHIRDRTYWVANANLPGQRTQPRQRGAQQHIGPSGDACASGGTGGVAHASGARVRSEGCGQDAGAPRGVQGEGLQRERIRDDAGDVRGHVHAPLAAGPVNGLWRASDWLLCRDGKWRPVKPGTFPLAHGLPRGMGSLQPELRRLAELAGLDKQSLARAKAFRVGSLRGYGNAINAEAARIFIEATVREAA